MTQTETETRNPGAAPAVPTLQSNVGGRWRGSGRLTADTNPANPAATQKARATYDATRAEIQRFHG